MHCASTSDIKLDVMAKQVGQTKDTGFQFGLQKTFAVAEEVVWEYMFSDMGLKTWLGELTSDFSLNKNYLTKEGIEGFVRVFQPYSHIRIVWKKKEWTNTSSLQIRIIRKADKKTLISFCHEKLLDANQRAEMKEYWNLKMNLIAKALDNSAVNST